MPRPRLDAENLLAWPAVYVRVSHATATGGTTEGSRRRPGGTGAWVGNKSSDPGRIDPILPEVFEFGEQAAQINGRHITQLVVALAAKSIAISVIVVKPQILGVG